MGCCPAACVFAISLGAVGLLSGGCDQFAAVGVAPLLIDGGPAAGSGAAGAGPVTFDAGGGAPDAAMADAAMADAGEDAAVLADAGSECVPPTVTGCNPVTNEGCPAALGMQCAVDLANTLAGYCIFSAPAGPPGTPINCLNTLVTESCAPMSACVDGVCTRLCFCDSDCDLGQCCNGPIAAHGFSACGSC